MKPCHPCKGSGRVRFALLLTRECTSCGGFGAITEDERESVLLLMEALSGRGHEVRSRYGDAEQTAKALGVKTRGGRP